MAWTIYNKGLHEIAVNAVSGTTDLRLLIVAGASIPAGLTDATSYDLNTVANLLAVAGTVEAAAVGYSRADLAGVTLTEDDTNNYVTLTWTAPVWNSVAAGETWRAAVLYRHITNDADSLVWGIDVFGAGVPTNGSNITYTGASLRVIR